MRHRNRFWIALLSAGLTFAALTASLGTDHWKRGHYWGHHHHGYYHHDCPAPEAEPVPDDSTGI